MLKRHIRLISGVLALGLLAFGVIAARVPVAHAQAGTPPATQAVALTPGPGSDASEVKSSAADTDTVDMQSGENLQSGDQTGIDTLGAAPDASDTEAVSTGPDTDSVQDQSGDQSGPQVEDGLPDLPGAQAEPAGG